MKNKKNYKVLMGSIFFCILVMIGITSVIFVAHNNYEGTIGLEVQNEQEVSQEVDKPIVTPEPVVHKVTLLAAGDNLMHMPVVSSGKQSDGTYDFSHLYKDIESELEDTDLSVINQETMIGGASLGYSGYPRFNSPTEVGVTLEKVGFDVVLHATNHTIDKGEAAVHNVLEFWKGYPNVTKLGIFESEEEANDITVINKNNIKIALLNYTESLNGLSLSVGKEYMVAVLDEEKVVQDIKKARELADIIVVFPHWGVEYSTIPSESQTKWANLFLENGVDLVIGTHPHVLQPIEWMESSNGHKMLVYYSIGNYVSTQTEVSRMLGGLANVEIEKVEGEEAYIKEASIIPVVTHVERNYQGITTYKLSNYTEEMAQKHLLRLKGKNFTVEQLNTIGKEILGDWWPTESIK